MTHIKITLPDGSIKDYVKGVTAGQIALDISRRLGENALAAKVNDVLKDLSVPINEDSTVQIVTFKDKEGRDVFWHSASHLMTQAVLRLFKGQNIGLGVGMPVEDGYYQDYDIKNLTEDDLKKIESEMQKIVQEHLEISQKDVPKREAYAFYKNDPYKTQFINEIPGEKVRMYTQGEFDNLCKGPHVPNTSYIKASKLTRIAGAYWKGDSKNKMLTRIYGISFPDKKDLDAYLKMQEEAEKRDHKKIGRELELYMTHELVGKGLPIWLPKGEIIKREIENFAIETERKAGYQRVSTPILAKKELYIKSGHIPYFNESMFPEMVLDDGTYYMKAMNCPHHHLIFGHKTRSYRDLPLRISEYGICHRYELSGVLAGLLRVRMLSMNDAHIYCRKDQIESEFEGVIRLIVDYYKIFGLDNYYFRLSLWNPENKEKFIEEPENWDFAENVLRDALKKNNVKFVEAKGEAAFYGPKVDIQYKAVTGREETMSTIQLDFAAKKKFGLKYADKDNKENNEVYVIHRAPLSTHERFMAFLIENYAGKFPLWLAPVQIKILTVADRFNNYAEKLKNEFEKNNLRVEIDSKTETISKKVFEAEMERVPLILVVGEKEEANNTVAVRTLEDKKIKFGMKSDEFLKKVLENVREKKISIKM